MVLFMLPYGASLVTNPAANASAGSNMRFFCKSRMVAVVRPRPLAIRDTWAALIESSMAT